MGGCGHRGLGHRRIHDRTDGNSEWDWKRKERRQKKRERGMGGRGGRTGE